jgi:hypothetical protein
VEEVQEIGRVEVSDSVWIVVRKVKFRGNWYVDIRKGVKTEKYDGLTAKGIFIPANKFYEILTILGKVEV